LHSTSGREVTKAFGKILASFDRRLRMLQTDKGTEFLNAIFQRMLRITTYIGTIRKMKTARHTPSSISIAR